MKKFYLFLLAICSCVTNVYSQLQVDSTGYVGIGITDEILEDEEADSIMSTLAVGTVGSVDEFASLYSNDKHYTISAYNRMNRSADGVGIYSYSYSMNHNSQGIVGVGTAGLSDSNSAIGVRGTTFGAANSVGVYGGSYIFDIAYENFAGVFGSTSSSFPYFQHSGIYAGYFDGTVRATGPMYAQAFYTPSANPTGGSNNENTSVSLIGEEENVTDKLRNVSSFELQHTEQQAPQTSS